MVCMRRKKDDSNWTFGILGWLVDKIAELYINGSEKK